MKKLIELLAIAIAVVLISSSCNSAFAQDRQERCLDLASAYQMAASLRDAGVAPETILVHLRAFQRTTERERQEAIMHSTANPHQSASTAFKAALTMCKYGDVSKYSLQMKG